MGGEVRCRSGRFCNGRNDDGPALTVNPLCTACVQDIQRCLAELPSLSRALHTFLGVTPKTALRSRIKRTPDQSCPLDPRVDALMGEVIDVVQRAGGYDTHISDLVRQPADKYLVWVGPSQQTRYLDGADRAMAIRRVHTRVNKVVGLDRTRQTRHAPCPDCRQQTLWNWVGDEFIRCDSCELTIPLDEYDAYCLEVLKES